MMMLKTLGKVFAREWVLTTIIVLIGSALCIRLGVWQLDRLTQRRKFNAHVQAMWAADTIILPEDEGIDLTEMEYRSICVDGNFDLDNQVAIRNQYWRDQYGYHLLTPVVFSSGKAVMVDRGWIPAEGSETRENWRKFDPLEEGEMCGIIRLGREKAEMGGRPDPTLSLNQSRLDIWNNVNLDRMSAQIDVELIPIYIQMDIDEEDSVPPIPFQPEVEINEGPHLGYAGQWFMFATILFFGYPFYIKWRESNDE